MNRILSARSRRSIVAIFLNSALALYGAVLRPASAGAQSPPTCYTVTELTLGGTGAQAMSYTRSRDVLGFGPDSNSD